MDKTILGGNGDSFQTVDQLSTLSLHSTVPSSQCLDLTTVIITASLSGHFVKKAQKLKTLISI